MNTDDQAGTPPAGSVQVVPGSASAGPGRSDDWWGRETGLHLVGETRRGATTRQQTMTAPLPGYRTPAPARSATASPLSPNFAVLAQSMQYCLGTAFEAWEGPVDIPFAAEDVRIVAITLECSRRGVVPQAVEEAVPF